MLQAPGEQLFVTNYFLCHAIGSAAFSRPSSEQVGYRARILRWHMVVARTVIGCLIGVALVERGEGTQEAEPTKLIGTKFAIRVENSFFSSLYTESRAAQISGMPNVLAIKRPTTQQGLFQSMLTVRGISKTFRIPSVRSLLGIQDARIVTALRSVNLEVQPGNVIALVGPNGAGKTTLIRSICDLIRPDQGEISVCGIPVAIRSSEALKEIGLLTTNERSFLWRLSGRQNIRFFGALYGLTPNQVRTRSADLMDRFGMLPYADREFRTYSSGMKQRLGIVRALLHDPTVLLLDEPTSNLDLHSSFQLMGLLRSQVVSSGKCVLWATHRIEELSELCDGVVYLDHGCSQSFESIHSFFKRANLTRSFEIIVSVHRSRRTCVEAIIARANGTVHWSSQTTVVARFVRSSSTDSLSKVLRQILEIGASIERFSSSAANHRPAHRELQQSCALPATDQQ